MNSEFLPEADEEFREAAWYYEKETPGVGLRFIAEVRRGVHFIKRRPGYWRDRIKELKE